MYSKKAKKNQRITTLKRTPKLARFWNLLS